MTRLADRARPVVAGVDTHKDVHVAAVVDEVGRIQATREFPTTRAGHKRLLSWVNRHGQVLRVGVEGTGAWGAGLSRFLTGEGVEVVEVDRPNRQTRRRRGKSDPADAEAAARAALAGDATGVPKAANGRVEMIRVLRTARRSARKASTQAANQMHALVTTAPDGLRSMLRGLNLNALVERCLRFRPGDVDSPEAATKLALRELARRHRNLTREIERLDTQLDRLVKQTAPRLVARYGIGTDTAGALLVAAGDNPDRLRNERSFAALCGVSPVQASSGQIQRHRLNRGGNRQANQALWRIAMVRLSLDPRTREYVERRRKQGRTKREAIRCLKRYIAREVYRDLIRTPDLTPTGP